MWFVSMPFAPKMKENGSFMNIVRSTIAVAVAAAMMIGATACSTEKSSSTQVGTTSANAGVEQGAFPTTITHRYGQTTIKEAPQRVVSLGYTDQDALLALGITPVSVQYWEGMLPDNEAAGVWAQDKITGKKPRLSKDSTINFEAIAEDHPDLIVAAYSDIDKETYNRLSELAPVVVQKGDYKELQQPWDVTTEEIGQAVGKPAAARALVQGVKDKFEALKKRHPEWSTKKLGVVTMSDNEIDVFSSGDPRSRFFTELGFTINPTMDAIAGDKFYGSVSKENIDKIDSDVLVWDQLSYSPKGDRTSVTGDSILNKLSAVKDGRSVYLEGDMEKAFGWQTVLSLSYLLDKIEKPLVEATS